jgi:hypothetical protein
MRVNLDNVPNEGLRIEERGRRMNSKLKDQTNKAKLAMLLRQSWNYKLNLGVSLAGLSWPLLIGGQVSRYWSGSIQIYHVMAVYIIFPYSNTTYIGFYLGPILLWALTQINPRGTNAMGTRRRTHVTQNAHQGHICADCLLGFSMRT